MRRLFFAFLAVSLLASFSLAALKVFQPRDRQTSFAKLVMLKGKAANLSKLKVNGQPILVLSDKTFSVGLILKLGKNYVEVKGGDNSKQGQLERLRLLRLATYPDIETMAEGKFRWARSEIIALTTLGLIEGYPDGYFYPDNLIERGEFATWLARACGLKLPVLIEDVFSDVPKEHWRAPFIKAVVKAGYLGPVAPGEFGLNEPISRQDAAKAAALAQGLKASSKSSPAVFVDVPSGTFGAGYINSAAKRGLVQGISKRWKFFDPERYLKRAEAAVLFSRFKLVQAKRQTLDDFAQGYGPQNYCQVNVAPQILEFSATPWDLEVGKETVVRLRLKLAPRAGFSPLVNVTVDLSDLGGEPDIAMYDDGTHGDLNKNDLTYSLNLSLKPEKSGEKKLAVTVVDDLGWESEAETSLLILE